MTFAAVQLRPSFSSTSPAEEVLKSKGTAFHQHPYHFAGVKPVNLVWDKKLVSTIFDARLEEESFERKLFEALISLKVVTAQYAMHLSADERHRLFDELDRLINFDDWHEED